MWRDPATVVECSRAQIVQSPPCVASTPNLQSLSDNPLEEAASWLLTKLLHNAPSSNGRRSIMEVPWRCSRQMFNFRFSNMKTFSKVETHVVSNKKWTELRSLCQRRARFGKLSAKNSLIVEEPPGSEGEVGEEAVHTKGEVLFQLRVGILHIFPFQIFILSTFSPDHFPNTVSSTHS